MPVPLHVFTFCLYLGLDFVFTRSRLAPRVWVVGLVEVFVAVTFVSRQFCASQLNMSGVMCLCSLISHKRENVCVMPLCISLFLTARPSCILAAHP